MRLKLILLLILAACLPAHADSTDPSLWTYHLSYHNSTATLAVGNTVYTLLNGNLLAYDTEDGTVTTYDRMSSELSDKNISYMAYSDTRDCLVLLYADNNVDLLYADGTVVNLPQIKNYTEYSVTPRRLTVNGNYATISTTEGVIVIDVKNEYVRGYYRIGERVTDAIVSQSTIYAAISDRIIQGSIYGNLYDRSQWSDFDADRTAARFIGYGNGFYMLVAYKAGTTDTSVGVNYVYPKESDGTRTRRHLSYLLCTDGNVNGNAIQLYSTNTMMTVSPDNLVKEEQRIAFGKTIQSLCRTTSGRVYVAETTDGLKGYTIDATPAFVSTGEVVGNFGPEYDLSWQLLLADNTLYMCGGEADYTGITLNPAFLGRYRDGEWDNMDATAARAASGLFYNMTGVAVNPNNADEVYASNYGAGIYKYTDGAFTALYNNLNSPLASMFNNNSNYVRMGGCTFDADGNLWATNCAVDSTLCILKKDGTWKKLFINTFKDVPEASQITFGADGTAWVSVHSEGGLLGLDYNGTIDNTADDVARYRISATNEDGTSCDIKGVKCVAPDRNGQIWFGCESGVYAIENPSDWFTDAFTLYQPKVPRNDGTNYADYLLTGITVTAIAVDGGNRKWLGTLGGGLYLASADGSEVIEHITADNTPLLSDNILSLALDSVNGILYIGTDQGLCTYRCGITTPASSLSKDLVKVYPNPVRAEYNGQVYITGLTSGAEVKIVSSAGQLVARGNAVGGSYLWNCQASAGGRVAPGVYFVLIATADGKTSVAAKVAVI